MQQSKSIRIAKNSLMLYGRTLITMFISLYTSRIILNTLGVEDYGIYSVVGGVVSMLSIISSSLTAASQRFITFELGKKENQQLSVVFSTTVIIHIALALIVFLFAETIGVWFLNSQMNIPENRMNAANWVFQGSMIAFMVSIITIPYRASVIAHEKMNVFAYISILNSILRLAVALLLQFSFVDKLKIYSILEVCVAIIIFLTYTLYSRSKFKECRFVVIVDKALIKVMASFAGWNFIGASSGIIRIHGINILLNIFYGVFVNAARGISIQVEHAVINFTDSFMTAIRPQITKSFAAGDKEYFMTLLYKGARMSYYLTLLLSLPIILETEIILTIWLKNVPEYAIIFIQLSLVFVLLESLSKTFITAMLATGKIRNYQIIVGGLQLLNLPLSYVLLKIGYQPQIVLIVAITISLLMFSARLFLLKGMIELSIYQFLRKVVLNIILVTLSSSILPIIFLANTSPGVKRLLLVSFISVISTSFSIYIVGCSSEEKFYIKNLAKKYLISMKQKFF